MGYKFVLENVTYNFLSSPIFLCGECVGYLIFSVEKISSIDAVKINLNFI